MRSRCTFVTRPPGSWPSRDMAGDTSTRTTSKDTSLPTRHTYRIRSKAGGTTYRPTSAPRRSSRRGWKSSGEACDEQAQLEQEIHRDRDQRLVERVGGRGNHCGDDERHEDRVAALLRK